MGLILRTGKLEENIRACKAICTRSSFPVLELRREDLTERRIWTNALPPSPYTTRTTSSSGKIKVIRTKFRCLFVGEKFLQKQVRASYFQAADATQPETNTILQRVSNYDATNVLRSVPGALQRLRQPYTSIHKNILYATLPRTVV